MFQFRLLLAEFSALGTPARQRRPRTIIVVTHAPVFTQAADRRTFIVDGRLEQPEKAAEYFEVGSRP